MTAAKIADVLDRIGCSHPAWLDHKCASCQNKEAVLKEFRALEAENARLKAEAMQAEATIEGYQAEVADYRAENARLRVMEEAADADRRLAMNRAETTEARVKAARELLFNDGVCRLCGNTGTATWWEDMSPITEVSCLCASLKKKP